MIKTFDLAGKVVIITGGYGYLGKAITENLLYHNAVVYVLGRSKEKYLDAFSNNPNESKTLFFVEGDVASSDSVRKAFEEAFNKEKKIDVLINNAFYSKGQSPEFMTDDEWDFGIDGSLSSVFRCIRDIIPYFKSQKVGKIINVSSMYGVVAPQFETYDNFPEYLNPPHYGAAKAGVIQLTKYYASFLGTDYNLQVNSVTPGPFPSEKVQLSAGFVDELNKRTALGRIGSPEDLAGIFTFLSSEASDFITGQNFIVDGGWTAK